MSPVRKRVSGKRGAGQSGFVLVLAGLVALGLAVLLVLDSRENVLPPRPSGGGAPGTNQALSHQDRVSEIVRRFSADSGMHVRSFDMFVRPPVMEIETMAPQDQFMHRLTDLLSGSGLKVLSLGQAGGSSRLRISLGRYEPELLVRVRLGSAVPHADVSTRPVPKVVPAARAGRRPRIALVLDDAGGDAALQWLFIELPVKLNFAVIPGLANSHRFARRAKAAGHEVMIHLPMQPRDEEKQQVDRSTLASGMNARDVERILEGARRSVPDAVALNNHMGSLATADRDLMRLFMPALRKRGLLFLDSLTHASSVAGEEAARAGMPLLRRDIFLDHVQERAYIENALRSLARLAAGKGYAIGIGHVTCMETWQVLRDSLKRYTEIGVDFVGITELE